MGHLYISSPLSQAKRCNSSISSEEAIAKIEEEEDYDNDNDNDNVDGDDA